ncbi:enhanced intracellular survival protein Eis [Dellaglioa sp. P0083]|uniref:GNAT family N-acetyltransferase n=1 Tax=Dellaglioa kimchii TaxID=3344667 RepID=UPI0038D35845
MTNMKLDETHFGSYFDLSIYAFNKKVSVQRKSFFRKLYEHSSDWGSVESGKVVSGVINTPFMTHFHGTQFKMGGIGYVASYPEFAGQGSIGQLMNLALDEMYDNGTTLSYLAPFSYPFYRKFGYEATFDQTIYRMNTKDLPRLKVKTIGHVERHRYLDVKEELNKLYQQNQLSQQGGIERPDWWLTYSAEKHPNWEVAVYYNEKNESKGYLVYQRETDEFKIVEWIYQTTESWLQLQSFVLKHQSAYEWFSYESPIGQPFPDVLANPQVEVTTQPYMMARIVNVDDFLSRYPYQQDFSQIVIQVQDSTIHANEGCWQISRIDGETKVEKTENSAPTFTTDIQNLTRSMMGYRTLKHLKQYGFVSGDVTLFDGALIKEQPILSDYF